jgi:putative transcriptional regulator
MNKTYDQHEGYFGGKLLLAMPKMEDPRFEHAVIFICGHDANGGIGLILNKQLPSVFLPELLTQLEIPTTAATPQAPLYFGGPVEMSRGFILHTLDYLMDSSVIVNEEFAVTATIDILRALSIGHGPREYLVVLGYTSWNAGQLEGEIQDSVWLLCNSTKEILFKIPPELKWKSAINTMGIEPGMLSLIGGHA